MTTNLINSYDYLAYNEQTEALLSHGPNAALALRAADAIAPFDAIRVISAGPFGLQVWEQKLNLSTTVEELDAANGQISGHAAFGSEELSRLRDVVRQCCEFDEAVGRHSLEEIVKALDELLTIKKAQRRLKPH